MIDDEFATYDAAYVLDTLSDDERRRYEDHLYVCESCTASVQSLRHLPPLLATVPPAVLEQEPDNPPVSLLPALIRRAEQTRRRRRLLTAAAVAVAAACVVLVVVLAWPSSRTSTPTPSPGAVVAMSAPAGEAVGVVASAHIQTVRWGTRIDLSCRQAPGGGSYARSGPLQLVIVDRSGGSEALGTWNLPTGRDITFTGGTSLPADRIQEVKVTTLTGEDLLVGKL